MTGVADVTGRCLYASDGFEFLAISVGWRADDPCGPHRRWGRRVDSIRGGDYGGEQVAFCVQLGIPDLICRAEGLRAGSDHVFVEAEVMVKGEEGSVMVAKASNTLAVISLNTKPAGGLATSD